MTSPNALVRRAIAGFVGIAVAVGIVVAVGTAWTADAIARADLVDDAEDTARLVQRAVVASLAGDPDRSVQDHFSAVLLPQVQAGTLVRVKVWEAASADRLRLVYSDLAELVGQEKRLRPDRAALLGTAGTLVLPVPDDAAHRTETASGRDLVEVLTAFSTDGEDYLLESVFATTTRDKAERLRARLLPVVLGGILLFALAMLPIAATLARRLARADRERSVLIDRATRERENERVRVSQQLHDGVLQDLAGAALALSAVATSPRPDRERVEAVGRILRRDVQALRGLLDDLVPAELRWAGLGDALGRLAAEAGLDAEVSVTGDAAPDAAGLFHRAARELLLNVAQHAGSRAVTVRADVGPEGSAHLVVRDGGRGFDASTPVAVGHLGLRIVEHAVRSEGGGMRIASAPGEGTTVSLSIPGTR